MTRCENGDDGFRAEGEGRLRGLNVTRERPRERDAIQKVCEEVQGGGKIRVPGINDGAAEINNKAAPWTLRV